MQRKKNMWLVSACLIGRKCKYNGGDNDNELIRRYYDKGILIPVCPEMDGGLPCPRIPCEVQGDKVIDQEGNDRTANYIKGAQIALETALEHKCDMAVLKAKSPSCGCHMIYDGTFTHTLIEGKGITARMLEENGIHCIDENEFAEMVKGKEI